MTEPEESQLASAVLMIRPLRFASNPLTAASNRFQGRNPDAPAQQQRDAAREFDGLRAALETAGIDVIAVPDTPEPEKPDAIFPNNWVSFHADGRVVLYPMLAPNRRTERRAEIIDMLGRDHGFVVREIIDLSFHEANGQFLEGTGSLVLDRVHRVAYACLSPRTTLAALGDFAQRLNYDVVAFDAVDRDGAPVYHTNVLMNVGEKTAVICTEAIRDDDQRTAVLARLRGTGHEIIEITMDQVSAFAGNMLELRAASGNRVIAMSGQASNSLNDDQRAALERGATIVSAPIEHIESSAGGSVRCMLAEIHLPRASAAT
jgi:hypothetical protein